MPTTPPVKAPSLAWSKAFPPSSHPTAFTSIASLPAGWPPTWPHPRSVTPPAPATQPDANAQQARQLLDKCIKALGGDAYLNIRNIKQTGRGYGFHHNEAAGVGSFFTRSYLYPDKERYDIDKDWYTIHT